MVVLFTFLLSILLCGVYLWSARRVRLFDIPNDRSSHAAPIPHGGGLALFLAFTLGVLLASWRHGVWEQHYLMLVAGALTLMCLGLVDDLRGLSVRSRLLGYAAVCLALVIALLPGVLAGGGYSFVFFVPLITLGMLWVVNLYNFMDGIDGIAGLQAVLACGSAALLSFLAGDQMYAMFCLLLAAAQGGFLVWNFPPARLFMGDAGSVPTGFTLAGLALLGALQGTVNPLAWAVLLAPFIADASWTLVWRMATGQAFLQPHRLHAYQRLSRHWRSHRSVDVLLLFIHLLWLVPLALAVQLRPELGLFLVFLAYLPLLVGMAKVRRLA